MTVSANIKVFFHFFYGDNFFILCIRLWIKILYLMIMANVFGLELSLTESEPNLYIY